MSIYVGYQGADTCTDGPQDGARELLTWFLHTYDAQGGHSDGIYNCRPVRGGHTLSLHGEGRAADLGIPSPSATWQRLADSLRDNSKELGIQCVIYDRHIWSGAHPYEGWRGYPGVDPHTGHLHVELAWAAARGAHHLTAERIDAVLAGSAVIVPVVAASSVPKSIGSTVARLQRLVDVTPDTVWGVITDSAALTMRKAAYAWTGGAHLPVWETRAQQILGVRMDGDVGPVTLAAMTAWVEKVQETVLGVTADGEWGPNTDAAFWHTRALARAPRTQAA